MKINYDERYFRSIGNTDNGEVSNETLFHYRQRSDIIWATYEGGAIRFGVLTGKVSPDGQLSFHYVHQNSQGVLMSGNCLSTPEILDDGRIRLYEKWTWTSGDGSSGSSVIEEIKQDE